MFLEKSHPRVLDGLGSVKVEVENLRDLFDSNRQGSVKFAKCDVAMNKSV